MHYFTPGGVILAYCIILPPHLYIFREMHYFTPRRIYRSPNHYYAHRTRDVSRNALPYPQAYISFIKALFYPWPIYHSRKAIYHPRRVVLAKCIILQYFASIYPTAISFAKALFYPQTYLFGQMHNFSPNASFYPQTYISFTYALFHPQTYISFAKYIILPPDVFLGKCIILPPHLYISFANALFYPQTYIYFAKALVYPQTYIFCQIYF